ncbi:hypothetical protein [Flavobacterium sp. 5]|uniref:hypothetical protein n=1 Tax=Flavobacterium sp. 5 TaxID=2035199 RepID=UPI000CCA999B|nr:hypothetical protein [Flavobacterium sp. 5]PKB18431.1 hypothetical protein CLU82_3707 [Flavobacterium sp. 5]
MKNTRETELLKHELNKKLENFRTLRVSNIQNEVEKAAITTDNEKPKSKGFFSKFLNK